MSVPADSGGRQARSYLYVPGDQPRFLDKARARGADAVIVDLEDAVAAGRKDAAEAETRAWLERQEPGDDEIWVRADNARLQAGAALAEFGCVTGVVVPKSTLTVLGELDAALGRADRAPARDRPVAVIALIESAVGLVSAAEIAASPRVCRLGVGRADLFAELGLATDRLPPAALSPLWLAVVVASAAAGIDAPIAPVHTDLADPGALTLTTRQFADLGFQARTAIHPAQVGPINEIFTPSAEQVERARDRVAWFEAAARAGSGVVVDADGLMVDEAVIRSARQVLRRWRAGGGKD